MTVATVVRDIVVRDIIAFSFGTVGFIYVIAGSTAAALGGGYALHGYLTGRSTPDEIKVGTSATQIGIMAITGGSVLMWVASKISLPVVIEKKWVD